MTKIFIAIAVALLLIVAFIALNREDGGISGTISSITSGNDADNGVLDLNDQGLKRIPDYVFNKTDIQKLDLSSNNLGGSLQAEVRQLQNLKVLNLSNNHFAGVPAEIGQLKNLEELNLSNNQIAGLPYELGNLSNLKVFDLRGNDYSKADLEIIKKTLPATTEVLTD
jgi:Leucine-rich repeat (LRR) protein